MSQPASTTAPNLSAQSSAPFVPTQDQEALFRVPRPRQIRMSNRGKIQLAVVLIVVFGFVTAVGARLYFFWTNTHSFAKFHTADWVFVGITALLLLILYGTWRSQLREINLLENGEIAAGRITQQGIINQNISSISYEFKDIRGQSHTASGTDYTQKLYEGMAVPVFYDSDNPKRNIAYCSTFHEVVI